ncbi:rRNA maturation RNase YbeY [Verrucomicrobiales bacterium BCK34]|nr:rRNA maturation RNase YbeY [Verrucomicrobiales bacterium BCK34]
MSSAPVLEIYSHTAEDISSPWLLEKANSVLADCLEAKGTEVPVLGDLEEIEISLVDDEAIADVHGQFLDDPTPTDVITFPHGEILVSVETAKNAGPEHGLSMRDETLLYIIHGLLHLNGHTDLSEPERSAMHAEQERILRIALD